jgi:hypothetical protein
MPVEVIHPFKIVEIDQEQGPGLLRFERVGDRPQQLLAVGKAGRRIDAGVALRQPFRLLVGVEGVLKILRPAPAEQDDRNVEEEGDGQAGVRDPRPPECRPQHLTAQPDEQDERGDRRAGNDQLAAGDLDRLTRHASRYPHVWHAHDYRGGMKIFLPRG